MVATPVPGDHGPVPTSTALASPKLWRRTSGRLLGGVAGGIADLLRISVWAVRAVFVVLCFAGGFGVVLYAVFWIVVPATPRPGTDGGTPTAELVVAAVAGVAVLVGFAWATSLGRLFIPSTLACLGAALLWRQAGEGERQRWLRMSRSSLSTTADTGPGYVRIVLGAGLVVAGCGTVLL